jgi:hypothetical protein
MTTLSAVRGVKARRPSPPAGDQQTNNERPSRDAGTRERCPPELANVSSPAHDDAVIPIVRHNVADLFFDEVTREHAQVSSR